MTKSLQWLYDFLDRAAITYEIGKPMAYDQHDNVYRTLRLGGVCDKNTGFLYATSEHLARAFYLKDLAEEVGDSKHIIWRTEPDVECVVMRPTGIGSRSALPITLWKVYSRLTWYPRKPT